MSIFCILFMKRLQQYDLIEILHFNLYDGFSKIQNVTFSTAAPTFNVQSSHIKYEVEAGQVLLIPAEDLTANFQQQIVATAILTFPTQPNLWYQSFQGKFSTYMSWFLFVSQCLIFIGLMKTSFFWFFCSDDSLVQVYFIQVLDTILKTTYAWARVYMRSFLLYHVKQ